MVASCWAMGRNSLDATKALLMRIALAEGRRLCRALILDRLPPFRVELVGFLAPVLAIELDLEVACLPEEPDGAVPEV